MEQTISRKNILRNEKGLTLLELLAVIVILGIIAAIAIPSIGGIIKSTKDKAHFANAQLIIDAARFRTANEGPTGTIADYTLGDLVDKGYMDVAPTDPDDKATAYSLTATKVVVTHTAGTGKYSYTVTLASNSAKVYGTWTEAELKTGKKDAKDIVITR